MTSITDYLKENADARYAEFTGRLTPGTGYEILGVRLPLIRSLASDILKTDECDAFLNELPHTYREENLLHAIIVGKYSRDYSLVMQKICNFLPYIDSWEVCDLMPPKIFAKHTKEIYPQICRLIHSDHEFTARFGIVCLMKFYLSDKVFTREIFDEICSVNSDKYYVKMASAWFFCDALIKHFDETVPLFENGLADKSTHNLAIKKANESYRLNETQKNYLKNLKR